MNKTAMTKGATPAQLIDERIGQLDDWRGQTLARLRAVITAADARIVEEWKWNVPVWSYEGIVCTGETYKKAVKLTFAEGASVKDPSRLFNSSLEGNTRRAIDVHEGDTIDAKALTALIRDAVSLNVGKATRPGARTSAKKATATKTATKTTARKAAKKAAKKA